MTQLGEGVAVGMIKNSGDECWFCQEEPTKKGISNSLIANPDTSNSETEAATPENDIKNDASALGENLGNPPRWSITCPLEDKPTEIVPGAHHCIPGTTAFKKVMDMGLEDFVNKGRQMDLSEDIGYSINHSNNGVWLPGNYV